MKISITDIYDHGFLFVKYTPEKYIYDKIMDLDFNFKGNIPGGMGGTSLDNLEDPNFNLIKEYYSNIINSLGLEGFSLQFDLERMDQGNYHIMHSHRISAIFQACIWVPKKNDYSGRYFIYGTKEDLKFFKPQYGDLVLMKPNDNRFLHGVSPLKSYDPVFSVGISAGVPQKNVKAEDYMDYSIDVCDPKLIPL